MHTLNDAIEIIGKPRQTGDGYLVMDCAVARSGIQEYYAGEMGDTFADLASNAVIRMYRPPEVIFGDASLASYAHKPLTNDHPSEGVSAKTWKRDAVGWTGDEARQEGRTVRVPMLMADADAIADVQSGKREWSAGYSVAFDRASGVTPEGEAYDAIVTAQKINHIALVDKGRAGPDCRIIDRRSDAPNPIEGDRRMAEVKMTFDGVPFAVADATAEAVVGKIITARDAAVTAKEAAEASVATLTASVQAKDAEIAALKKSVEDSKITPQALRDAAKAYAKVTDNAKRIAPDLKLADDADAATIMAAVVAHKLGDAAKGWTEAQNEIGFATLSASLGDAQEDGFANVIRDHKPVNMTDYDKAQADYIARTTQKKVA